MKTTHHESSEVKSWLISAGMTADSRKVVLIRGYTGCFFYIDTFEIAIAQRRFKIGICRFDPIVPHSLIFFSVKNEDI